MSLDKMLLESKTNYKVYTPVKIAREIVAKALSFYFAGDKNKKLKLKKLKAIDLSCGNGNLLIVLLESLIKIHKIYHGFYGYNPNWVEGYDLDETALEDLKKRVKELLKKYDLKGTLITFNTDALTHRFEKSYNIILGNPPYLGEKNNREIFEKIKKTDFGKKYYEGKMDYLYFFIEKGLEILEPKGLLSYISTNYWLSADGAKKLRETIKTESTFVYINNINKSVFKDALGQHNIIFTLQKKKNDEFTMISDGKTVKIRNRDLYGKQGKISLLNPEQLEFCKNIEKKSSFLLGDKFFINQGIVSGYDEAFIFKEEKPEFKDFLKPFYKNKNIGKYSYDKADYYILYLDGKKEPTKEILEHLMPYKNRLENRREVKKGFISWWQLQWSREKDIFERPKIVARQRNRENNFVINFEDFYASADVYYLSPKYEELNIYYILAYLNSELFYKWFKLKGKNKGEYLELYATPLKEVPIIYEYDKENLFYIENLVKSLIKEFSFDKQKELNEFFNKKL